MPLAFSGLPIYVHAPKFYAGEFGLSLTFIGTSLLLLRILDALIDPLIGAYSDRFSKSHHSRYILLAVSSPVLAVSFYLLFAPIDANPEVLGMWFIGSMVAVYFSYSVININYQSLAAEITTDYNERTRVASVREALALIGVLLASVLPQVLSEKFGVTEGFFYFSLIFVPLLAFCLAITVNFSPRPKKPHKTEKFPGFIKTFKDVAKNKPFLTLVFIYVFNGIAASIPATLVLFFIEDVVGGSEYTGYFLLTYFLSGAFGMPIWNKLAARYNKRSAWLISMVLSVVTFIWAFMLGDGDITEYYIICILSGINLGADLALPPSLLADTIDGRGKISNKTSMTGSYFGVWNLVTKLNLALAAGITLPLLDMLGYIPGETTDASALNSLSFTYAVIPCVFKVIAFLILALSNLDKHKER